MRGGATLARCGWEVLEARLLVEGLGIVNFAADFLIQEMLFESVTASGTQNAESELIPDMIVVSVGDWQNDIDAVLH